MQAIAQRYQLLPGLTPEEYEALKADIAAHGIQVPIEVDEDGNVLDGYHRLQAARELGIPEEAIPKIVRTGLTEEQKREHALRMNLLRRQLTREQKRDIAVSLRQEGWTQTRIAQALGVAQATVHNWLAELAGSVDLPAVITDSLGRLQVTRKPHRDRGEEPEATFGAAPESIVVAEPEADGPVIEEPEDSVFGEAPEATEPEGTFGEEQEPEEQEAGEPSQVGATVVFGHPAPEPSEESAPRTLALERFVEEPSAPPATAARAEVIPLRPHVIKTDNADALTYLWACQPEGFPAPSRLTGEEYAWAVALEAALNVLRHTYERADRGRQVLRAWKRWKTEQGQEQDLNRSSRLLEAVSRWMRQTLALNRRRA